MTNTFTAHGDTENATQSGRRFADISFPDNALIHTLFEAQVARTPQRTAVLFEDLVISYAQLNARADALASALRVRGVGPGDLVGLCIERGPDMLASMLAILKAGAAYVPLDPQFPRDRLDFMAEDAALALLMGTAALCQLFKLPDERLFLIDAQSEVLSNAATAGGPVAHPMDPESPAYTIYTSGSTGRPKGVVLPHRAAVNFLASMAKEPGLAADDVLLAVTTLSFDIAALELLLPIVVGASVVISGRDEARDGQALKHLIEKHGATVMQATPVSWGLLIDAGWMGQNAFKALIGGEALPRGLAEKLLARGIQLWNMYGPTETTIWSTCGQITSADNIHIGRPIRNTDIYIVDAQRQPVPDGATGELLIGGAGVSLGYLNRPELTAEKFIELPGRPGATVYCTGDLARLRPDGTIECLGRLDHQIKIRGYRIELGEIEAVLDRVKGIGQSVVVLREDRPDDKRLVAYFTEPGNDGLTTDFLRSSLLASIPDYMVPSVFQKVDTFPLTPNGKIDRKALPVPGRERPHLAQAFIAPRGTVETQLAGLWCELLEIDRIGIDDNFFDLGGKSLTVFRLSALYKSRYAQDVLPIHIFQYPTIAQLAKFLERGEAKGMHHSDAEQRARAASAHGANQPIAIVGMVGRFPGADTIEALWRNLCEGVESITFFTPEELGPGIDERLRNDPDYVRARGLIEGADTFDAAFFGISPLEAKVMDPQQRVFLELAQQALENAGYDPERYQGQIGVYAGIGDNHYYTTNLLTRPDILAMAGKLAVEYGNQKDYIALRTAYLLDLRGPAVSLNTACSTTLLAVDQACAALRDFECDLALAGGVDITVPQKSGFLYQEGGTFARDGHCRPFDADATGTMFCDGAGIVVLKRLSDALADGDTIYATIIGTGKNNNGARPVSFLAPSVEGQAEAIARAQARAGIPVETIGYIEAHGTGTPMGDPIEMEALRQVFQAKTDKQHFCYVGSIKGNIGHPTNAAGVASVIKTALTLHHGQIPATLHFKNLNPKIDLSNSPFRIADRLLPFPRTETPRRAATSAFGFGGTNVHVILEEAAVQLPTSESRSVQLIPLSARTDASLDAVSESVAQAFEKMPLSAFADAAFTLQIGRKQMTQRRYVVAASPQEAAQLLRKPTPAQCGRRRCERRDPPIVFMFGGQGTQYVNMGENLYREEPLFRAAIDDCCEILKPHLGRDLRELLYPADGDVETARTSLQDTFYTQPAIFVIEYSLARLWQSFGIQPAMMVGHSIGEFVAATLAGVWALEDALRIIALRGRLMQALPRGSMLAVGASADVVDGQLPAAVQIASNNSPTTCVVAGPDGDVAAFKETLEAQGLICRHLHTSHAFHSAMMDPLIEDLRSAIASVGLRVPKLPLMSTVTGRRMADAEATDPAYWAHHARATVQFSKAAHWLVENKYDLFLECGPRATLSSLVRQQFTPERPGICVPSLSDTHANRAESIAMLFAVGALWQTGVSIDWDAFYVHEVRRRVPLPTYHFERKRYWVEPALEHASARLPYDAADADGRAVDAAGMDAEAPRVSATPLSGRDRLVAQLSDILLPISGLERSQISATATFLEQGFNSLSLTQVAYGVQQTFGIKVTFSQLMNQLPNLELLAEHLEQVLQRAPAVAPVGAAPASKAASNAASNASTSVTAGAPLEMPTTAAQQEIWYPSKLRATRAYNQLMQVHLRGALDAAQLHAALQDLVNRNDALRITLSVDGTRQFVQPEREQPLPLIDLSDVDRSAHAQRLDALLEPFRETSFKFTRGPLMLAQLVRLSAKEHVLQMVFHHVVIDGWSTHVVGIELSRLYSERVTGIEGEAPAVLQLRDYLAWYTSEPSIQARSAAKAYWLTAFADKPAAVNLPTKAKRPEERSYRGHTLTAAVNGAAFQRIKQASAASNATLFNFVLASTMAWLYRITGQNDIVVGVPVAGQVAAELQQLDGCERLMGHLTSLLPIRAHIDDAQPFAQLVSEVKRAFLDAKAHEACSYGEWVQELKVPCAPGALPVVSVILNLNDQPVMHWSGLEAEVDVPPRKHLFFDLEVNMWQRDDALGIALYFADDLFDASTVSQWLQEWTALVERLAHNPAAVWGA